MSSVPAAPYKKDIQSTNVKMSTKDHSENMRMHRPTQTLSTAMTNNPVRPPRVADMSGAQTDTG